MTERQKKRHGGFTLIEIMIAIFLLVVGLTSVLAVMTMGINANTLAQQMANASTAALDVIEQLRNVDFDATPCVAPGPCIQPGGDLNNNVAGYSDVYTAGTGAAVFTYRRRWQVFDTTGAPPNQALTPDTRVVVVRILPNQTLSGTSKIVELRTAIVDRVD